MAVNRRSIAERAAIALALLPSWVVALAFLRQPVVDPLTISALLIDRALLIASIALLVGGPAGLVLPPSGTRILVGAAAVAAVVISVTIALAGARGPGENWVVFVSAVAAPSSLVLAAILIRPRLTPTLAVLLAPAALLPLLQFWHQTAFVPAHLNASVGIANEVTFVELGDRPGTQGTARVRLSNTADTQVLILASDLHVWCRRGLVTPTGSRPWSRQSCHTVTPFDPLFVIESENTVDYQTVFDVWDEYRWVETFAWVGYARGDRLRVGSAVGRAGLPSCIKEAYLVREESQYKALVQSERLLVYGTPADGSRWPFWFTERARPRCRPDEALEDYYGVGTLQIRLDQWIAVAD